VVSCYQAASFNTDFGMPAMTSSARKSIDDLLAVMAALRTPGSGCPWDLEQTFKTIAPYTIEEAYEVAAAIEQGDLGGLKDELGDLLLQVVYHARIAEETGAFAFPDVAAAITAKMIRRHPHVFGSEAERAAGAAPGFWERIKAKEREGRDRQASPTPNPSPQGEGEPSRGVLADVPVAMPALTRAVKLQDKAARVGFDWPSLAPVFDKLKEELAELEQAVATAGVSDAGSKTAADRTAIEEEFGDLLFVVANVARHLKIDPEGALRAANQKFIRRFGRIETLLAADGRTPSQSDLAEMDRLWDRAKTEERGG
jgi:ATP diphosphatase